MLWWNPGCLTDVEFYSSFLSLFYLLDFIAAVEYYISMKYSRVQYTQDSKVILVITSYYYVQYKMIQSLKADLCRKYFS